MVLVVLSVAVVATFMPGCGRCHLQGEFKTATERGTHGEIACGDCHGGATIQSRVEFGVSQVFGMHLPFVGVDPTISSVANQQCLSCHETQIEKPLEAAGLRVRHETCSVGRACTDCHSPVAHGAALKWPRTSTMEMCFECHGKGNVRDNCDLCHSTRLPRDRVQTGTFAVTHGPNNRQTHGMGDMNTCGACHESEKCAKCHGLGLPHEDNFVRRHGPVSQAIGAKCTECHAESFCTDCHGYEMPHTAEFTPEHGAIVDKDGTDGCTRCHNPKDCTRCHEAHVHPTTIEQLEGLGVSTPDGGGQ